MQIDAAMTWPPGTCDVMKLPGVLRACVKYGLAAICVSTLLLSSLCLQQLSSGSDDGQAGVALQTLELRGGADDVMTPEAEQLLEQRMRRHQAESVCTRMRTADNNSLLDNAHALDPAMFDNMYVDTRHKLVFCEIPKVACTNFKIIMLLLTGQMNTTNPTDLRPDKVHGEYSKKYLKKLSSFSEFEIKRKLKHYFKVMIVRDPLERLLSAYRNKFTVHYNDYFKLRFGRQIIRKYRDNPSAQSLETGGDVTFEEFVRYLLDPVTQRAGEFNPHWRQYYKLCHPCELRYDFIGKYESIERDIDFLLRMLGVSDVIKMPASRISGVRTGQLMEKFFRNISSVQLHSLWQLYSTDFNMFGYSYPEFTGS